MYVLLCVLHLYVIKDDDSEHAMTIRPATASVECHRQILSM